MDIRRVVGKNIRRAGMGVEQGYVSRLEAGERNPTIVTIWDAA
jgi:transcriptional regulator with XRE-family HTH domain